MPILTCNPLHTSAALLPHPRDGSEPAMAVRWMEDQPGRHRRSRELGGLQAGREVSVLRTFCLLYICAFPCVCLHVMGEEWCENCGSGSLAATQELTASVCDQNWHDVLLTLRSYPPLYRGLHFLAVQPDPDSEELKGLWLLQDREPPQI